MSQPAAPANLNIRVFTQSGPKSDICAFRNPRLVSRADQAQDRLGLGLLLPAVCFGSLNVPPRASLRVANSLPLPHF
jgi:hypothetical protein